jgi:GNAT superfamily N-acetyltransferase
MSESISIRPGTPADAAKIMEAQISMARETENLSLDPAVVERGVRGVFEKPERGTYWIAEIDSQIAGMLLVVNEWSDWRNRYVWWIHSVYTWRAFRGRGVYKALYQHLKNLVENDENLAGLRLYVERDNARAQSVYRKMGMRDDHYALFEWLK